MIASAICFWLLRQLVCLAFSRAFAKTGKRMAARMAMIAITTNSSISVNPFLMLIPPRGRSVRNPLRRRSQSTCAPKYVTSLGVTLV